MPFATANENNTAMSVDGTRHHFAALGSSHSVCVVCWLRDMGSPKDSHRWK